MLRAMPVLQVRDVTASEAFYARLGFSSHGVWGDPPAFCITQRGTVTLALDAQRAGPEQPLPLNQWWAAYVYVEDADALHAEFSGRGIGGLTEPGDRFYGCRDFDVIDPDGHRIAFGHDLNAGPGLAKAADRPGLRASQAAEAGA